MATRWGIVSAGKICNDFVLCLQSLPTTEHQIVAIAARNVESAKQFAIDHSLGKTKIHDSYEDLANDPDVEIAYIGNLCKDHLKVSKMMLEAGKHVLCEKPMCMNIQETELLINAAIANKRFLMEAIWSRFFPAYKQLQKEISQGTVGTPNLIDVMFVCNGLHLDRLTKKDMGASAVLDIGIYAVQLILLVFGKEKPLKITANGFLNKEAYPTQQNVESSSRLKKCVDEVAVVSLEFSQERIANFTLSFRNDGNNEAVISGPKGFIRIPHPFHCPTILETPKQKYVFNLPQVEGTMNFENSQGLRYEAIAVRKYLQQGLQESPDIPLEESKLISEILTEIRCQLGVEECMERKHMSD